MSFLKNIGKIFGKSKDNEVKKYEKALSKTRNEFVNRLNFLGVKYTKIDNALFQELEEILIMSDIGVMTAINLTEKLKKRVKEEKIENF
uniref:signal recognition particle receptor subunit alpha n=1 Tax=uncultured Flavonifractor sp. TaxID=1193534 RepID=UPI00263473D6